MNFVSHHPSDTVLLSKVHSSTKDSNSLNSHHWVIHSFTIVHSISSIAAENLKGEPKILTLKDNASAPKPPSFNHFALIHASTSCR